MEDNSFDNYIWYKGLCNIKEVERIKKPVSGKDVLLRERADIIIDNVRLSRLYVHKRRSINDLTQWSFENSFDSSHYVMVINNLPQEMRKRCSEITYGDMYAKQVNAYAYPDKDWGEFICVNMGLKYYIYFMNLALCDPIKNNIPAHVTMNALRIAIRVWLGIEALDFEMDPRGKIDFKIMREIQRSIPGELAYIVGHEYCHHILGHFDNMKTTKKILWNNGPNTYEKKLYNTSQKQEFEADIKSLQFPKYNEKLYKNIYESALIWFLSLDIGEAANECIMPSSPSDYHTHPVAIDRFFNVLENVKRPIGFSISKYMNLMEYTKILKEKLQEDITSNYDTCYDEEKYGSVYLDKPNTKWRGKQLIDRVDY